MFPIPDRIIGSRQLLIPLVYIGVTITLCYYFLLGFVHTTNKFSFDDEPLEQSGNSKFYIDDSPSYYDRQNNLDSQNSDSNPNVALGLPLYRGSGEREREKEKEKGKEGEGQKNLLHSFNSAQFDENQSQSQSQYQNPVQSPVEDYKKLEQEQEQEALDPNLNSDSDSNTKQKEKHGTRRSKPSEIRNRHQNNPDLIDPHSRQYFPWPNDEECKHFSVRFAKRKMFKPRALVSYPGSGNSWIRYVIDGGTGIFTGSVYNDKKLTKSGLWGEVRQPNDGSTIIQKTHHDTISQKTEEMARHQTKHIFGYRGVLIIRNPFDAIRSFYNYRTTHDHKGIARTNEENAADFAKWAELVEDGSKRWANLIESWITKSKDYLIVEYDEMRANPRKELIRILNYLKYPIEEERLDCVMKHIEGPFHRRSSNNSNKMSYTAHHSHLDLMVQQQIDYTNRLFAIKDIPLRLNYTLKN